MTPIKFTADTFNSLSRDQEPPNALVQLGFLYAFNSLSRDQLHRLQEAQANGQAFNSLSRDQVSGMPE